MAVNDSVLRLIYCDIHSKAYMSCVSNWVEPGSDYFGGSSPLLASVVEAKVNLLVVYK
jgi:hypothetical protein